MFRTTFAAVALLALTACGVANAPYAPDEAVAAAHYVHGGPPAITLFTVINNKTGGGAHSGLMINGSERVLFDPAGSWYHPKRPERNDVHYGIDDRMVAYYIDYHARVTYRVVEQTVVVSPQVAEMVMARAKAHGAVPKAHCADSISQILSGVPGFESIHGTWFPNKLSEEFAKLPGATSKVIMDDDADDNHGVLMIEPEADKPSHKPKP
jgi:hypothetical protein